MEKLSSTEKRRKSDAFDMIKEAIGRVYETICCSLVNQRCACSSISRGTIRKLRGGKIKGNQPSVPTPSFDLSRLSFSSTSCMPSLSLPCLLLALDLDPRRRWRRHVDWRDFYAVFGGRGDLSSFGFKTREKREKHENFQSRSKIPQRIFLLDSCGGWKLLEMFFGDCLFLRIENFPIIYFLLY